MALVKVSEDAPSKSYYKYFIRGLAPLPVDFKKTLAELKVHKEGGLSIHDRNIVAKAGTRTPVETGVYVLPEGGMLVSSNIRIPNVTGEMLDWFFPWQILDPLRYAIWNPEEHVDNQITAEERKRILNPDIPIHEKIWGVTFHATEAMGGPPTIIDITFRNPAECGYDDSECDFLITSNSLVGDKRLPVHFVECAKKIDGEMELQLRFWIGYHVVDGEAKYLLPPQVEIPYEAGFAMIGHNFREFNNLAQVLPDLYSEEKDNW